MLWSWPQQGLVIDNVGILRKTFTKPPESWKAEIVPRNIFLIATCHFRRRNHYDTKCCEDLSTLANLQEDLATVWNRISTLHWLKKMT
jgi:hypothetical protein